MFIYRVAAVIIIMSSFIFAKWTERDIFFFIEPEYYDIPDYVSQYISKWQQNFKSGKLNSLFVDSSEGLEVKSNIDISDGKFSKIISSTNISTQNPVSGGTEILEYNFDSTGYLGYNYTYMEYSVDSTGTIDTVFEKSRVTVKRTKDGKYQSSTTRDSTFEDGWIENKKDSVVYNTDGNISKMIYYSKQGLIWKKYKKNEYTYNNSGKLISIVQSEWSGTVWVLNSKYEYSYTKDGDLSKTVESSWSGTIWKNLSRNEYEYQNEVCIKEKEYSINGNHLTLINTSYYNYNSYGNISEIIAHPKDSTEADDSCLVFYNSDKNPSLIVYRLKGASSWLSDTISLNWSDVIVPIISGTFKKFRSGISVEKIGLKLHFSGLFSKIFRVEIFNSVGRIVEKKNLVSIRGRAVMDISDLSSGFYTYHVKLLGLNYSGKFLIRK